MHKAFIVCGPPAAGKTTHGRKLAAQHNATLLDIDTVTETMVRASLQVAGRDPNDRDSPWFKTHFRQPIYDTLFAIAAENLLAQDVIIIGPFTREIQDPNWPDWLAQRLHAPVEIHFVTCPPEIRHKRMIARGEPRDLPKLKDWETFLAYYGDEAPPVFEHVSINTG